MQQHDDDPFLPRIIRQCKPCGQPVGETWETLGDTVAAVIAGLAKGIARNDAVEARRDDAAEHRQETGPGAGGDPPAAP